MQTILTGLITQQSIYCKLLVYKHYVELLWCFLVSNNDQLDMVSQSAYSFSMMFIKCSILSFYGSIFSSKRFRYCLWFVSAVVIIWALSFGSISLLQSMPKTARLDETVPKGTSIDYGMAFVVGAPINIITDFIILSMPIPLVWRLHVTKKKKLLLCFTFAMGGSACLISIIRLAVSLQDHGAIAGECKFNLYRTSPTLSRLIKSHTLCLPLMTQGTRRRPVFYLLLNSQWVFSQPQFQHIGHFTGG